MRTLVHRAVTGIAVVAGVLTLTFLLLHAAPGDPAELLLGPSATAQQIVAGRHTLGLDRPLATQYVEWLGRFVRGRWGTSIVTGRPVRAMLGAAWPATVRLTLLSLLLSYGLGLVIGAVQAARAGSRLDTTISVVSVSLVALPGFWLGLMLVGVFTYLLRVLPAFGAAGFDADFLGPWGRFLDGARHLALPLATLTLIGLGAAARFVRGSLLDVLEQPFVVTARAKGLSGTRVLIWHALRNAATPIVTLLGLSLPALFSGAVFIEGVFAWPGVGRVLVEAVQARDYPVVMAATAISAILVVLGNMLADILAVAVDPRLRARDAAA
ncbi:MAG TPA: ABC transporter permease [Gemmatimonadales bacterium]|nr:ABC transporter permease [Gemmatimonadales bacterium]